MDGWVIRTRKTPKRTNKLSFENIAIATFAESDKQFSWSVWGRETLLL